MNLENELRQALRRQPAPTDFAANVLARVAVKKRRRVLAFAIAAGLAAAALIPPAVSAYHWRRQAVEAHRELLIALAITRTKLIETQARLERAALRSTQGHTP
jgi:hypothetical protein